MGLWEVLTTGHARAAEARGLLTCTAAGDLLCGAVGTEVEADPRGREADGAPEGARAALDWVRPQRFLASQRMALSSCMAWHPGLFRQMAQTTAGVCVRFATDAREVALAVRMDPEPHGTTAVLEPLDRGRSRRAHDGVSAVADGRPLGCAWPRAVGRPLPWIERSQNLGIVTFSLDGAGPGAGGAGMMTIPGLGSRHEVCLWLPCLRGCAVRELWTDGTYVEPLPARPRMLVLGDSIAQGFAADDPAAAWPALLAEGLGLDLLNQSVGGQVFQSSSLPDDVPSVGGRAGIAAVVVALGTNYRWDACAPAAARRDARAFLAGVRYRWPEVPTWVATPLWHDERRLPARAGTCWEEVPGIVDAAARELGLGVVDGRRLMDRRAELLADGEHPTARGHAIVARRMQKAMGSPAAGAGHGA